MQIFDLLIWNLLELAQTLLALPETVLALTHYTFIQIMHPLQEFRMEELPPHKLFTMAPY